MDIFDDINERFMSLISSSLKSNSPLLSREQYDEIVIFFGSWRPVFISKKIEKNSTK